MVGVLDDVEGAGDELLSLLQERRVEEQRQRLSIGLKEAGITYFVLKLGENRQGLLPERDFFLQFLLFLE